MRFVEFAPAPNPQEGTLVTLLQFLLAKSKKPGTDSGPVKIPTDAVLQMMNNTGTAFSYEDLEALVNSGDKVKNLIKGPINRKEIEIGTTSAQPEEPPEDDSQALPGLDDPMQNPTGAPPAMDNPGDNQVAQMASRATNRAS